MNRCRHLGLPSSLVGVGLVGLGLVGLGLVGACDPIPTADPPLAQPIDHESAALTVEQNLRDNLAASAAVLAEFLDNWLADSLWGDGGPVDSEGCGGSPDVETGATQLIDFVLAELFTEENVERADETSLTYLLPISLLCHRGEEPTPVGDNAPEVDVDDRRSECEQLFSQVPIRLRVTSPAEGDLDIEVLVGVERLDAVTLRLYRASLGVAVDLASARHAIALLASADATASPPLPDTLEGRVELELAQTGEQRYALTLSLPTGVSVVSSEGGVELYLGAAAPAMIVELDGVAGVIGAQLSLAALSLLAPLEALAGNDVRITCDVDGPCEPEVEPTEPVGEIAVYLAGLTGRTSFGRDDQTLAVNGVGLGGDRAAVTFDGASLVELELNPLLGGLLNFTARQGEQGVLITVTPGLELLLGLNLETIADQLSDIPTWALRESLRVVLDQDEAPAVLLRNHESSGGATTPRPETDDPHDAPPIPPEPAEPWSVLQVESGRLLLEASSLPDSVDVATPDCLNVAPAEGSGDDHPFGQLEAGVCI